MKDKTNRRNPVDGGRVCRYDKERQKHEKGNIRMKKRVVARILALTVLLGAVSSTVYAAGETETGSQGTQPVRAEEVTEKESTVEMPGDGSSAQKEESATGERTGAPAAEETAEARSAVAPEEAPANTADAGAQPQAESPSYMGEVTFVGQWTGESSKKVDTVKAFAKASDLLGDPVPNPGTLKSLAKVFLGWSDQAPTGNGKLAEGARLFSKADTIKTAFPGGIPAGAKLYGVYFSLNSPDAPFSNWDLLSLMGSIQNLPVNDNTVTIDGNKTSEEILPDTTLWKDQTEGSTRTVIDLYEKKDDVKSVHEVVLNTEFKMDDTVAMLTYKNPLGSNAFRPVLSYDYNTRYGAGGDFGTGDGKTGYTYVDLKVNLDQRMNIPEKLYLEYEGYSWRPLYVFGDNKEVLSVFDPVTGADLGNTKASFKTLVNNQDPKVKFGVQTGGNHNLTVRMVLREGADEKIPETAITPAEGGTIAEKILSNMKLNVISKAELKAMLAGKTEEELNKSILTISDATAEQLAATDGKDTLQVTGAVTGNIKASAGSVNMWGLSYPLSSESALEETKANTIALGYTRKYNVTYTFVSGTAGKELPEAVTNQRPKDQTGLDNQTAVQLPGFADVKTDGGTWKFRTWYRETADGSEAVENSVTIDGADLRLTGEWFYVEDPETYNVTYTLISGTQGKDLPEEIIDRQPTDLFGAAEGEEIKLPAFEDVKVADGTWRFKSWYSETEEETAMVEGAVKVGRTDLNLIGEWLFVKAEDPKNPVDPDNQPVPGGQDQVQKAGKQAEKTTAGTTSPSKKQAKTVKTGDRSPVWGYATVLLLSGVVLSGVILVRRKRR